MAQDMIAFYVASAIANKDIQPSTASHNSELLHRVFKTLKDQYGVEMEERRIIGLDTETLQRWFIGASRNWKPATVNNYVNTLNPFFRWAHKMRFQGQPYLEDDLSGVLMNRRIPHPDELPEEERPKDKYYTKEQVHELLYGMHGRNLVRDRAIMGMFLYTGLRVSELCALTIAQVMDVPHGSMRIRRKGGAWSDVAVAKDVYPLLEDYLATRGELTDRNAPLFMTTHGKPCNRNQIYKALSFKQEELGLATGPHAFRHTAVSEVANRFGAAVARDFANHKSFAITNRYAHTTKEQRSQAANALPWAQ